MDAGVRALALRHRLPDLRHAERRQVQRDPGVPRAHRRPACGEREPGDRQAGLVVEPRGAGQAGRHQPLLRHRHQRHRRLHGHHRAGLDESGNRPALRARPADGDDPRHGAGPGHADRPPRHRHAVFSDRRLDGRHAGAAMGRQLPRAGVLRHARRHPPRGTPARISPSTRSVARRSWPTPTGARAATSTRDAHPGKGLAVARMAAHITYLSNEALQRKFGRKLQERDAPTFSFDADFQIENYLRYQGLSFVDRFDANSYLYVTRACDLFRSRRRLRRPTGRGLPRHQDEVLRGPRSRRTGSTRRRPRATSSMPSTPRAPRSRSSTS